MSAVKRLKDFVDEALKTVQEVPPEEAMALASSGEWLVLDVREPDEYSESHMAGSVNIPRGFLEVKADLEHHKRDARLQDRRQRILCYCGGGHRSALAAKVLQEMGFLEALSMKGGWRAWQERNLPEES